VKVTLPPEGRLTLWLIFPDPLAAQLPPPAPAQVQVTPVIEAGTVSVTVAPVAVDGPALEATIVYVIGWPGVAVACPSVFVMARSAIGVAPPPGTMNSVMLCAGENAEKLLPPTGRSGRIR
jgi:hypothetical protein